MCGIVGVLTKDINAVNQALTILKKLEYRGYDSCGIGFFNNVNELKIIKAVGKINQLEAKIQNLSSQELISHCAIAHTRWATHGSVNEINTHPHESDHLIIVQNGIIENYQVLKNELLKDGYHFYSSTDTEVLVKLLDKYYLLNDCDINLAIQQLKYKVQGNYSVVCLIKDKPNCIYGFCHNTPFVIGESANSYLISSDVNSIIDQLNNHSCYFLNNDEILNLNEKECNFINLKTLTKIAKQAQKINYNNENDFDKNGYDTFMLKEMNEQSQKLLNLISSHYTNNQINFKIDKLNEQLFENIDSIRIIGCGSAYNSGLIGKYFIEMFAKLKVEVVIASEFRYQTFIHQNNCLNIIISQSGETADTLASLRLLKQHHQKILAIVNVMNSSIANEVDDVIYMRCGTEYAVASTKAYSSQALILILLALKLAKHIDIQTYIHDLTTAIQNAHDLLNKTQLKTIARNVSQYKHIFFIGRGLNYALSLEAALKLKEISYLNANAYPAGELKHGPISLIDSHCLVIGLIDKIDDLMLKTISNLNETKTRKAQLLIIAPKEIEAKIDLEHDWLINNGANNNLFSFWSSLYLCQLLAYSVARDLNNDVDNPKNLAKAVTVE